MNNTNGQYRHPQHDRIAEVLRSESLSDPAVAKMFGVYRKTVNRIRRSEGIPIFTASRSTDDVLAQHARLDVDGHTYWDGPRDTGGAPQIRVRGRYQRASHIVFEKRHGRPPTGYVKADCEMPHCLTGSHIMDDLGRRNLYMQMRAMFGMYGHWNNCSVCGADWETSGRVQPSLQVYCNACSTRRSRNNREVSQ